MPAVSAAYTYTPIPVLGARERRDFVKYLPRAEYEVYVSPVTARARFHAPTRARQRHNSFANARGYDIVFRIDRPAEVVAHLLSPPREAFRVYRGLFLSRVPFRVFGTERTVVIFLESRIES